MASLTVTRGALADASPSIQAVSTYTLPAIEAVAALATIAREGNGPLQDLEKARVALCEKHAAKEHGVPVKLPDNTYDIPDRAAFEQEWNRVRAESVTLANCRALKMSEFAGATQLIRSKHKDEPPEILRGIPATLLFGLGPFAVDDLTGATTAVPEPTASA